MNTLSLPLVMTGFLVMPVSAEMHSPAACDARMAVMVSKRVPRGGGLSVVLPGNSGPGRSIVALGETEVILRLEEELSARGRPPVGA